jgi:molybdate transport system substrate-binding protein
MKFVLRAAAALALAAVLGACDDSNTARTGAPASEQPVVVFAAASLTDVMREVGDLYAAEGHPAPQFNFAGSSALARQIEQGARADVFLSADEAWMDFVAAKDLINPATRRTLLTNSLVLVSPASAPMHVNISAGMDLVGALRGGKLALADPDSVPAGKYGKEALEYYGVWESVAKSAARADNVRAALRFVETGDAAAGIVYFTDAQAAGDSVLIVGRFPEESHTPVTYPAAILADKADGPGNAFFAFLTSDAARKTFASAGFGWAP